MTELQVEVLGASSVHGEFRNSDLLLLQWADLSPGFLSLQTNRRLRTVCQTWPSEGQLPDDSHTQTPAIQQYKEEN